MTTDRNSSTVWTRRRITVFTVLALLSVIAKIYVAGLGHNFDLESWKIFADIILEGKTVYAETYRNPYGPIWSYVCAAIRYIQLEWFGTGSLVAFHRGIAFLLALVDIAIAVILARRHGLIAGSLFLINPLSVLISGFHTQFGNVAVLLALLSCIILEEREGDLRSMVLAMSLLGVSLATKHILVFLPLWFFLKPGWSRIERLLTLLPLVVFAAFFVPFVHDERSLEGIIEHVFLYDSVHLDGFFPKLVGLVIPLAFLERLFAWVPVFSGFKFVWFAAMILGGFVVRGRRYEEILFVYLAALLVFSSALANQYLAIPLATCSVYFRNVFVWVYYVLALLFVSASGANIGTLPALQPFAHAVQATGLDRWHSVAALGVFLMLYLLASRRTPLSKLNGGWLLPALRSTPSSSIQS